MAGQGREHLKVMDNPRVRELVNGFERGADAADSAVDCAWIGCIHRAPAGLERLGVRSGSEYAPGPGVAVETDPEAVVAHCWVALFGAFAAHRADNVRWRGFTSLKVA
jgi:hypothetical protein